MNIAAIVLTIVGLACIIVAITVRREARRHRKSNYLGEFKPKPPSEP